MADIKFERSSITIAGRTAAVFVNPETKEYFYSQTSIAALVGKDDSSPLYFFRSKHFKTLYSNGFNPLKVQWSNGATYNLIPCDVASEYIIYQSVKGNKLALDVTRALTMESLEVRATHAFGNLTVDTYQEVLDKIDRWFISRERGKECQGGFQYACMAKKHPAPHVHNRITKLLTGYTAAEARKHLPTIDGDAAIGLNHHADPYDLDLITMAKYAYTNLKSGSWQEQVDKAVNRVKQEFSQALSN